MTLVGEDGVSVTPLGHPEVATRLNVASPRRLLVVSLNARDQRWSLPEDLDRVGLTRRWASVDLSAEGPLVRARGDGGGPRAVRLSQPLEGALVAVTLRRALAQARALGGAALDVLFVFGLETTLTGPRIAGLGDPFRALNQSREALSGLGATVVFVVPAFLVPLLRDHVGDLWSWVVTDLPLGAPDDPVDLAWLPAPMIAPSRRSLALGERRALTALGYKLRDARRVTPRDAPRYWRPWRAEDALDLAALLLDGGRGHAALAQLESLQGTFRDPPRSELVLRALRAEALLLCERFGDVVSLAPGESPSEPVFNLPVVASVDIERASIVAARVTRQHAAAARAFDRLTAKLGESERWHRALLVEGAALAHARGDPFEASRLLEPVARAARRGDGVDDLAGAVACFDHAVARASVGDAQGASESLRKVGELAPTHGPLTRWCYDARAALSRGAASDRPPALTEREEQRGTVLEFKDDQGAPRGRYELLRELDSRDGETVWKARDLTTERLCVLRRVQPELLAREGAEQRFEEDVQRLLTVEHPNLAPTYGAGVWRVAGRRVPCVVVAWVEGTDLERWIARTPRGRLSLQEALEALLPVLDALGALHAAGIVHRHLRPSSVVVARPDSREGYLTETGVAQRLGAILPSARLTIAPGALVGTVQYLSPEAIRGEAPTPGMDVWSLAMVLFECLSGRYPWRPGAATEILAQILATPVPRADDFLRRRSGTDIEVAEVAVVADVLARALHPDAEARYATAEVFRSALVTAVRHAGGRDWIEAIEARRRYVVMTHAAILPPAPGSLPPPGDDPCPLRVWWSATLPEPLLHSAGEQEWRRRALSEWVVEEDAHARRLYALQRSPVREAAWVGVRERLLAMLGERYGAVLGRVHLGRLPEDATLALAREEFERVRSATVDASRE